MSIRGNQRTHEVRFRVTKSEWARIDAAATAAGLPTSAFVRAAALKAAGAEPPSEPDPDPHAVELAELEARIAELRRAERRTPDRASDSGANAPRRFVHHGDVGPSPKGIPRDAKGRGLVTRPSETADELGETIRAARERAERSAQQLAELVHAWFSQQTQVAPGNHAISEYTWRKRISKLENGAATGDRKPTRGDNWKPSPAALREILAALASALDAPELRPELWRGKVL